MNDAKKSHLDPLSDEELELWKAKKFSKMQARCWDELFFTLDEACEWRDYGFYPESAAEWGDFIELYRRHIGCAVEQPVLVCSRWVCEEFTPDQALTWVLADVDNAASARYFANEDILPKQVRAAAEVLGALVDENASEYLDRLNGSVALRQKTVRAIISELDSQAFDADNNLEDEKD